MSTPEEREQDRLVEEVLIALSDKPSVWVRRGKRTALLPARAGDIFAVGQLVSWRNGEVVVGCSGYLIGHIAEGPNDDDRKL